MKTIALLMGLLSVAAMGQVAAKDLQEIDTKFTFHGHPIHPMLVHEFEPLVSDSLPSIIVVDVATATGSNRYYDGDVKKDGDRVIAGDVSYQWIGRLSNGEHVVRTWTSFPGGTMVAEDLLFLRVRKGRGHNDAGQAYDQLLMSVERCMAIGDRARGEVHIHGNDVILDLETFPDGKKKHMVVHGDGI